MRASEGRLTLKKKMLSSSLLPENFTLDFKSSYLNV